MLITFPGFLVQNLWHSDLHHSFSGLKRLQSNSWHSCVVCGGRQNIMIPVSFAYWRDVRSKWLLWPSRRSRRRRWGIALARKCSFIKKKNKSWSIQPFSLTAYCDPVTSPAMINLLSSKDNEWWNTLASSTPITNYSNLLLFPWCLVPNFFLSPLSNDFWRPRF